MSLKRYDYCISTRLGKGHVAFGTIWERDETTAWKHARSLSRNYGPSYRVDWIKHVWTHLERKED